MADNLPRRGRRPAPRPDPARIERARQALDQAGLTVADWAAQNGEEVDHVYAVLKGTRPCTTGAQHRIAVKLGIKDGSIGAEGEADDRPAAARADNRRSLALDTQP